MSQHPPAKDEIELTIVMPCLNEADTLETGIRKARQALCEQGIMGEALVADNGSADGSVEIARRAGARIIAVQANGYGHSLMQGTAPDHGGQE